jgi:hypothetical protein
VQGDNVTTPEIRTQSMDNATISATRVDTSFDTSPIQTKPPKDDGDI